MNTIKKLQEIKKNPNTSDLKKAVINDLISYGTSEEIEAHIKDIIRGGGQSGIIYSLIYYVDTHKFAKKYSEDIMDILETIKEETGEEFSNYNGDRLNTLAWLGYEETTKELAQELGIDY